VPFGVPAIVKAGEVPEQRRMPAQKEALSPRAQATKITLGHRSVPWIGADHSA
jgi:hypothetical protein